MAFCSPILIDTNINIHMQSGLQCKYKFYVVEKCELNVNDCKCEFTIQFVFRKSRKRDRKNRFTFSIISIHFINKAYDCIIMDEIMFDRLE